jgi:hypothetical protein
MYSLGNLLCYVIMQNTVHLFESAQNSIKNETSKQHRYFEKCKVKEVIFPSTRCVTGHWKTCSVAFKIFLHGFFLTFNNQCKTTTEMSGHGHSSPVMAQIYYNSHELDFLLAPVDYINTQSKMCFD